MAMLTSLSYAEAARKTTLYATPKPKDASRLSVNSDASTTRPDHLPARPNIPSPIGTGRNTPTTRRSPSNKPLSPSTKETPSSPLSRVARHSSPFFHDKWEDQKGFPSANLFACLEVEGESDDSEDEEFEEPNLAFAPFSPMVADDSDAYHVDEEGRLHGMSPSVDYLSLIQFLISREDKKKRRSSFGDDVFLPDNPPPTPSDALDQQSETSSVPHTPDSFSHLTLPRPCNPTPLEARFGPYHLLEEDDESVHESNLLTKGWSSKDSSEATPRLWKIMGWSHLP